ncbi:gp53-like domain-containing protein [Chromobacterium phragmitis]|uniref:Putative tail fiber protein gp53-like C-terminal domain-containing protein n=1 Tax=Chromobacterium phragmitis TaxID=2202141 RepID=A0ABV0J0T6_9NEIS
MRRVGDNRNPVRDKFGPGRHGFGPGDPQTGHPATTPGYEWFDALQEEVAAVIEAAGIALDPSKNNQLSQAILKLLSNPAFSGPVRFSNGSAAAPSLTFSGDEGTGIFHPLNGLLSIACNGLEIVKATPSGMELMLSPICPTAAPGTNNLSIANTVYVNIAIAAAISAIVGGAPNGLNTLQKLAASLNNDPSYAATVNTALNNIIGAVPANMNSLQKLAASLNNDPNYAATVNAALSNIIGAVPVSLNSLQKLASAVGNDPNHAVAVNNALAGKANVNGNNSVPFNVANASLADHAVALGQFFGVFAQNGYRKLPDGTMIQWGITPIITGGNYLDISYPIAFSSTVYSIVVTPYINTNNTISLNVYGTSASQFRITNNVVAAAPCSGSWIAIGK